MTSAEIDKIGNYKTYALGCVLFFFILMGVITLATIMFEVFLIEVFLMRLLQITIVVVMYYLVTRVIKSYERYVLK